MEKLILIAGATGNLGMKITKALIAINARVRVTVRPDSDPQKIKLLEQSGAEVVRCNLSDPTSLAAACANVSCVVSALSGLEDVIIDTQKLLVDAAIESGVPRFIPSDYSLDFTKLAGGGNRNLDLRKAFHVYLDTLPIRSTTVFNGAFMDLVTGEMPLILYKFKKILSWGKPSVKMDFTVTDNVAEYVARVATDDESPRFLRIAGDTVDANDVRQIMSDITGKKYSVFRPGGIGRLNAIIRIARFFSKDTKELYPAWQGMQYMRDMMEGKAVVDHHDNNRYPGIHWINMKNYLLSHNVS